MPRIARGLAGGATYHILNRGNGRQEVFHKDCDYKAFIDLMTKAKELYLIKIFAYCLMPNHFHIVLMPREAEDLSRYMHWLMSSHVRRYHRHYGSSGHIWQGRYKSFIIQEDGHLLTVLKYVETNPNRAGLVKSPKEWLWSSHKDRMNGKYSLLDKPPLSLPDDWAGHVDTPLLEKELKNIRKSVNRQSPYGLLPWQIEVSRNLGLESTLRPRGRPKKNEQ